MSANTTLSLQSIDADIYNRYNVHLEDFIHLMDFTSREDQQLNSDKLKEEHRENWKDHF